MHEAPISSYGALSRPTPAVRSYCLHQSAVEDVHGFVAVLIIQSLLRPPVLSLCLFLNFLPKNENGLRKAIASMQPSSRGAIPPMSISLSSRCREWLINTCFLFFCKMLIIQFLFSSLRHARSLGDPLRRTLRGFLLVSRYPSPRGRC